MNNKIMRLLSVSFIALIIGIMLSEFTNLIPKNSLPNTLVLDCIVIPAIFALWIYRKNIPSHKNSKRIIILGITFWITLALIAVNIVSVVRLFI